MNGEEDQSLGSSKDGKSITDIKQLDKTTLVPLEGNASFIGSAINLLKSIMGAGMLALPAAFGAIGVFPALLLLLCACLLAMAGLQLLVKASNRLVGEGKVAARKSNFAALSQPTYPRLAFLFEGAVFLKCSLVCASYMTVAADVLVRLGEYLMPNAGVLFHNRIFWTSMATLVIAPIAFLHKMDSLKYTSFLGLAGIAYLFVLSVIMFFSHNDGGVTASLQNIRLFTPFSFASLSSFATFVFALNCHQNIFPIYNEIKDNRSGRLFKLISLCTIVASSMYAIFAISFLGVFGSKVNSNVINDLPNGIPFEAARILYALLMLFSFPLQLFPSRNSLIKLISPLFDVEATSSRQLAAHIAVTCGILMMAWTIAALHVDLKYLISIVGCTAGPIICYFLPAIFWLKLEEQKAFNKGKLVAWALIIFGAISTIIPLIAIIWSIINSR